MKKTIFMLFLLAVPFLSRAQGVPVEGKGSMIGIKSNIPYWATATFNLGAEVYLARHWTLELEAGLNPFSGKNDDGSYGRSLKHLRLHPELRYWFCETFNGHFLGVHTPYLLYNVADIKWLGTEGERHQDGARSWCQLWILLVAISPLELRGHGGRGLSVLEIGQVSLRELRPQARRDQEALLRAYAGGDQSHLPILNRWRTEK